MAALRVLLRLIEGLLDLTDSLVEFVVGLLSASCKVCDLPPCFLNWVDRQMPKLEGAREVRFHCCDSGDMPLGPLVNGSSEGLTLGGHVLLRRSICPFDPCDVEKVRLVLHEFAHAEQFHTIPGFTVRYALTYVTRWIELKIDGKDTGMAYINHPYEKEARKRERELTRRYVHENPCGCVQLTLPVDIAPAADDAVSPPVTTAITTTAAPTGDPRVITASDLVALRAAGRCASPRIGSSVERSGAETVVTVWAWDACGVKLLQLRPAVVDTASGASVALPVVENQGACLSFRKATVRRALAAGARLEIEITAEGCAGDTATSRLVVAPP